MTPEFVLNQVPRDGNTETTSQKKVEANRRNAQLSPGPTSAEGKKTSSRNASKHGLLTKDVVVTTRAGREDQAEFNALLAEFRDCYRPSDIAEDLLVQELANSYWRSARAVRCERGDLTCAGATARQSELSEVEIAILTLQPAAEAYSSLLESSRGIKFLLLKAEQIKGEVEATGRVSTELLRWLAPGKNWDRFPNKKAFLDALEKETERLTAEKGHAERDESQWRDGRRDCSAIPSTEVLDRIHRYETGNVRHRYKVEARLEQRQARRKENAKVNSGKDSVAENPQDTQFCETKPTGSDDGGLRKGPHSVGPAGHTSDDSATPPIKMYVAGAAQATPSEARSQSLSTAPSGGTRAR
jgi:hypothetical protein